MRIGHRCFLGILFAVVAAMPACGRGPTPERGELDRRLAQALDAAATEASANSALLATSREDALRALVKDAPDYAPARAELGELSVDGRWMPVEEAQELVVADERLKEYEGLKASSSNGVPEQVRLARWCERNGLDHEARRHWLAVLEVDPNHNESLKGMNLEWIQGTLWESDLADEAKTRAAGHARSAKSWERRLRRFESRRKARPGELDELRDEFDVGAIGPIERRVANLLGRPSKQLAERDDELVKTWIAATNQLDEVEVTASLCRIATLGTPEHRRRAIDALHNRPQIDSMPLLLSALVAPIDSEHRINRDRMGNVSYEHKLRRKDADSEQVHERLRTAQVDVRTINPRGPRFGSYTTQASIYEAYTAARFDGLKNELAFQQEADATDLVVDQHNQMAEEVNRSVVNVLAELTGNDLGDEPHIWWDHWRELTGYEVYDRPIERTYEVSQKTERVVASPTIYEIPPPPPSPRHECFVAGTPVWTRDGQKPIEAIQKGDLVLARDPHRGGLTYRVVTDTTLRKPSPMVAVTLGGETIHATEGHPFWVVNQGWRMARQLTVGDVLSTLDGPTTVEAVASFEDRPAHNLVVESAANYYVGTSGVLVHDNTPRRPAVGLVASR